MRPEKIISYFTKNPLNIKKISQILLGLRYSSNHSEEELAIFFKDALKLNGLQGQGDDGGDVGNDASGTHYFFISKWVTTKEQELRWKNNPKINPKEGTGIEMEYEDKDGDIRRVSFTFKGEDRPTTAPSSINKWKL